MATLPPTATPSALKQLPGVIAAAMRTTPLPDGGVRLGEQRAITLSDGEVDYQELRNLAADDQMMVAVSESNQQGLGTAIIAIDLTTGQIQRITDFGAPRRHVNLNVSEQHIAWIEVVEEMVGDDPYPRITNRELHLYDLRTATESVVVSAQYISQLHYRHGLAVWYGVLQDVKGLHGYDVVRDELFIIEAYADDHIPYLPRACNRDWLTYLLLTGDEEEMPATLYARNLMTGQDIEIGTVIVRGSVSYSRYPHDCDQTQVVWNHVPDAQTKPWDEWEPEMRLYDLATGEERLFHHPSHFTSSLILQDQIVTMGHRHPLFYDLTRDVLFQEDAHLRAANLLEGDSERQSPQVVVAADRVIDLLTAADGTSRLYVTEIQREP